MCTISLVLWVVDGSELLNLIFGVVGDNYLNRVENSTYANGTRVQIITNCTFKQGHIVKGIDLGVTNLVDEVYDTFRAIATTTESTDGWHTWIVPTVNKLLVYQC